MKQHGYKVAVYAICKNEEQFVEKFMKCASEADAVFVLDTGSTDNTVDRLREHGAIVNVANVRPWRFDVARNISLSFVPEDYDICVCFDLDEEFSVGWRKELEEKWDDDITRCTYLYVWSHDDRGNPEVQFMYEKIHARRGFRWVHPVHEVLEYNSALNEIPDKYIRCNFELHHWPDKSKSRGQYLPLLEMSVEECPNDDRNMHYLAREYYFYGMFNDAITHFKRHLDMPSAVWDQERAASMRYIAECYRNLGDYKSAMQWGIRAIAERPNDRESFMEAIKSAHNLGDYVKVCAFAEIALSITSRELTYICNPAVWNEEIYEYYAFALYSLSRFEESLNAYVTASKFNPSKLYIQNNIKLLQEKLNVT